MIDDDGRTQTNIIKNRCRNITATILNHQLSPTDTFQPVAVTCVSYLGKMSERYFGSGSKSLIERAVSYGRWFLLALLVAILVYVLLFSLHS